jgi:iron(II)-dependent oxidoreductase
VNAGGLIAAREATLRLVEHLDDEALCAQAHPDLSPIAWHLGHVAYTEALWILERCAGDGSLSAPFAHQWAQGAVPKPERGDQPPKAELFSYLARVRDRVLEVLPRLEGDDPLLQGGFVAWMIEAHEHQHRETMVMVRQLALERGLRPPPEPTRGEVADDEIAFATARTVIGTNTRLAYDNERPAHEVELAPFAIDRTPATVATWESFRSDRGYERESLWTAEGWRWRTANDVRAPRGWTQDHEGHLARVRLDGTLAPLDPHEPVFGISWYEADAFARWRGRRLPTEAEWEHAARSTAGGEPSFLGTAWQWTATPFAPYPGFSAFPYRGYSEPYFDGAHFVLRGGSFATAPAIARPTFRNWYAPETRYLFSGVRCARLSS